MRRGLTSSLLGVLASAGLATADDALPPTPTQPPRGSLYAQHAPGDAPRPVLPVIPQKSDAGTPFVAHPDPYVEPHQREPFEHDRIPRVWVSGEYLMRWMKSAPLHQPLVTSSVEDPIVNPGVLGQPGTVVLLGGENIDELGMFSGVRLGGGVALDRCHTWGLEASATWLEERGKEFSFASDAAGNPVLSRPIRDPATDTEGVFVIAFPDAFAGRIAVEARAQYWGAETNVVRRLYAGDWGGVDLLGGVRYAALEESLNIRDASLVLEQGSGFFQGQFVPPGDTLAKIDSFETRNQFYGAQIGLKAELRKGNWYMLTNTKLALGNTHQVLNIAGSSTLIPGDGSPATTVPGGLLAVATNSGRFVHDSIGVIPELTLNVGYQVSEGVRVYVGYDLTYWNSVIRPGDAIDRNINRFYVPTSGEGIGPLPAEPNSIFRTSEWWIQGVNFGVAVRF